MAKTMLGVFAVLSAAIVSPASANALATSAYALRGPSLNGAGAMNAFDDERTLAPVELSEAEISARAPIAAHRRHGHALMRRRRPD